MEQPIYPNDPNVYVFLNTLFEGDEYDAVDLIPDSTLSPPCSPLSFLDDLNEWVEPLVDGVSCSSEEGSNVTPYVDEVDEKKSREKEEKEEKELLEVVKQRTKKYTRRTHVGKNDNFTPLHYQTSNHTCCVLQKHDTERVRVQPNKHHIHVISYGGSPFYINLQKKIIIPNGFTLHTISSRHCFVGTTKVNPLTNKVKYKFASSVFPHIESDWEDKPTAALNVVNKLLNNPYHKHGTNGCLAIGVTYARVQERIREVFCSQLPKSWYNKLSVEKQTMKRQRFSRDCKV
jgi:hypothetical protein